MVPRADIIAISDKKSLQDLAQLMITNGKSRIPVYKDTLDNIIGIAHGRDVLEYMSVEKNIKISEIIDKDVVFISPAMRALDLLKEMQLKRTHLVLVVDEYGGIDGLVTDQDLIEKIVGELEDNHDFDAEPQLMLMENGSFDADAKFPLEEIENEIGEFLTEEETENVDTIGGLAFYLLGRVPLKGEVIVHSSGLKMRINAATPRQVIKLTIYPVSKTSEKAK
jgi:CBS domain containing-hemolysin-like protein